MKRPILLLLVLLVAVGSASSGYTAWRRDGQYRALVAAGDLAAEADDTFGAVEAFSGAIVLRPSSMLAWLKRGEVYLKRGDYRSALRDLRQAVTLDPAALRPLELFGDTQAALERHARAAELYEAFLNVDDRDARVLYKLALVRFYEGQVDSAIDALERALGLDERLSEAHHLLGVCFGRQGRISEAIRALERAVALAPAQLQVRRALADQYGLAGRQTDEVRQLEAVTALDPGDYQHHIALARAWARASRPDHAVTTLVSAIDRFPDEEALLVALGRVWLDAAEADDDRIALSKALVALRRAAAASPTGPALALLGRAQLASGDPVSALQSLQRASASLPVDPRTLGDLAAAADRLGRTSVARDARIKQAALTPPVESGGARNGQGAQADAARFSPSTHGLPASVLPASPAGRPPKAPAAGPARGHVSD